MQFIPEMFLHIDKKSIWKGLIQQNSWGFTLIHTLHGKIILSIVDQNYQAVYMCNELGKGRPRLETGSTDDGLSGFSKNRHNPVMVYNDEKYIGSQLQLRPVTTGDYLVSLYLGWGTG